MTQYSAMSKSNDGNDDDDEDNSHTHTHKPFLNENVSSADVPFAVDRLHFHANLLTQTHTQHFLPRRAHFRSFFPNQQTATVYDMLLLAI